jgi:hypothetical protein
MGTPKKRQVAAMAKRRRKHPNEEYCRTESLLKQNVDAQLEGLP